MLFKSQQATVFGNEVTFLVKGGVKIFRKPGHGKSEPSFRSVSLISGPVIPYPRNNHAAKKYYDFSDCVSDDMPELVSYNKRKSEQQKNIELKGGCVEQPECVEISGDKELLKTLEFFADKRIVAVASSKELTYQKFMFNGELFLGHNNMVYVYFLEKPRNKGVNNVKRYRKVIDYFYKKEIQVTKMLVTKLALIFLCNDGELYITTKTEDQWWLELRKLELNGVNGKVVDMVSSGNDKMVMYITSNGEVVKAIAGVNIIWKSRFINKSIVDMAFSGGYVLFVSDNGEVYVIGPGEHRKYERDEHGICNEATLIKFFVEQGIRIRRVALNNSAMLFVSDKGAVYISVKEGKKFGLGRQAGDSKPKRVGFFDRSSLKITDVYLDNIFYILFLTENGEVYVRYDDSRLDSLDKIKGLYLGSDCFYQKERLDFLMERGRELVVEEQQQSHTFTLATSKLGLY